MFDFGNNKEKEIESLKQVIAKLTFENMEKDKTVDYLIGEVNKLSNRVKELEEEFEKEKEEKEEWYKKGDEEREYKLKYRMKGWMTRDDTEVLRIFFSVEDVEYIEKYECIKKINRKIKNENNVYEITYFKINNQILTPEYLKNEIQNKRIPMYKGIPFRKIQDLYRIMRYLESEKNIDYKKEVNHIDITNKITFEDKTIYFNDIKIKDDIIKRSIKHKDEVFYFNDVYVELYRVRNILCFNNKEFKSVKELKKLIKEKCYKDKKLLISVIDNL